MPEAPPTVEGELLFQLYRKMVIARRLAERMLELKEEGKTAGPLHLSIGQEAVGVGVASSLEPEDVLGPTFRNHPYLIGRGLDLRSLAAEAWGKAAGVNGGRAGPAVMAAPSLGIVGPTQCVGTNLPFMVGQALATKMQGVGGVVAAVFGDGAANVGEVHESMNLAAVWRLPVLFVCENNQYGLTTPFAKQTAVRDLADRAAGYGLRGAVVDGNDVEEVFRATVEARRFAIEDETPSLLEMKTYRLVGFSTNDLGGYQPEEEIEEWRRRDPLAVARSRLMERGTLHGTREKTLIAEAAESVEDAVQYALQLPDPDPTTYLAGVLQ